MAAIVMNTLTGAVSEYDGFDFQSITPTQAGSATGLFTLGGDLDGDALIVAEFGVGQTLMGSDKKKHPRTLYFSMHGTGDAELDIESPTTTVTYYFPVRESGESRVVPGRGTRENYLGFTARKPDGADFRIDKIRVLFHESALRRV